MVDCFMIGTVKERDGILEREMKEEVRGRD